MVESMMPAYIKSGRSHPDQAEREYAEKTEEILQEWDGAIVDGLLETLRVADYVIVKLVEPFSVEGDLHIFRDEGDGPFAEGNHEVDLRTFPGSGLVETHPDWECTPDECVEIARQYLSAARIAEESVKQ